MRLRWWLGVACAFFACNLGAEDHRLISIDVASTQPNDPTDGLFVEISSNCGDVKHDCLLQATAVNGALRRAGDDAITTTFCQHQISSTPVPVILYPASGKTEVVVQARLLDGDATTCEGAVLAQAEAVVTAKTVAVVVDGGSTDAQ